MRTIDDERASWRSPALGEAHELELEGGTLRYHAVGSGPPIVFVHGLLMNANLWRGVVSALASDFRCVALDMPYGSHIQPMHADADLGAGGLAKIVANAIDALDLEGATLVGSDSGGAISQLVVTAWPERIGRLVLTSCDAFEHFPPRPFGYLDLKLLARLPSSALPALLAPMRLHAVRRLPFAFGWLTKRPIERPASDSYLYPALIDRDVRHDLRKAILGFDSRRTLAAAEQLRNFERPALIAWSREDKVFPTSDAERLAALLPNARLEWIDDAYAFSPEDRPDRVAELIAEFARQSGAVPAVGAAN